MEQLDCFNAEHFRVDEGKASPETYDRLLVIEFSLTEVEDILYADIFWERPKRPDNIKEPYLRLVTRSSTRIYAGFQKLA